MVTANKTTTKASFLPTGMGEKLQQRLIEFAGVGMIALAIALILALTSYSASDPSLNTATLTDNINNLLGLAGALTSDLLLQSLGLACLPFVILLAAWGWRLVTIHRVHAVWLRLSLLPFVLLSLALALSHLGTPDAWPLRAGLSGVVGDLVHFWTLDLFIDPVPQWCYVAAVSLIALGLLLLSLIHI